MSRLAKRPITVPLGVNISKENNFWIFRGPKGEAKVPVNEKVSVEQKEGAVSISGKTSAGTSALLGTMASLVKNAVKGVTEGYEKKLELEGIGYKAQLEGGVLVLSLGLTHPVKIEPKKGVTFKVEKNLINVSGSDKEVVGQMAAEIRSKKPPEPYKGKGIHYLGEFIRRKAGKKAVGTA
ncbi:MAG: 50S ribosomal protein L6 [Patescibacteria group bacterium]